MGPGGLVVLEELKLRVETIFKQALGAVVLWVSLVGCGSDSSDDTGGTDDQPTGGSATASETDGASSSEMSGSSSADEGEGSSTSGAADTGSGTSSDGAADSGGTGATDMEAAGDGAAATPKTIDELRAELATDVSWTDLEVVYPKMYSAFIPGSDILFKVPANIQDDAGETIGTDLSGWSAYPEGALSFDADTENGGVVATIVEYYPEILIAYNDGFGAGGTAELYVTEATEQGWENGNSRYNNDNELDLPLLEAAPAWGTPEFDAWVMEQEAAAMAREDDEIMLEGNFECTSCHTTGAKYFEIQHTPTQVSRFSDEELLDIFTMGKKPSSEDFRLIPPEGILGIPADELYADFHTWEGTEEELSGIVIYLRSLTPEGQGDIRLANGEYVSPDSDISAAGL